MQRKPDPLALRVSLVYSLVAGLWILFSDQLLGALAPSPEMQTRLSICKGWAFVAITAALLYLMLARTLRHLRREVAERARIEEELRWRTTFLKAQVDSSPDGIVVVDTHGKIILENQRCLELWKIPPNLAKDPENSRKLDYIKGKVKNPASFTEMVAHFYAHPDEAGQQEIELADGTVLDSSTAPVKDETGKYYGRIWTFRDNTLRRRAENALVEREQQLSLFIQHSPVALAMLDRNLRYLAVSQRWLTDYRLTGREILGQNHYEIFPEMPPRWKEAHQRCLAGAVEKCDEDSFVRADGLTDWLRWEIRPWRNPQGEIGGIVIFSEDITQRKRTEAALLESQAIYHSLVEQLPIGIFRKDAEGRYVFVNAHFYELKQLPPDLYLGKLPSELPIDPVLMEEAEQHHTVIMRTGRPIEMEETYRRPNGEFQYYRVIKSPVLSATGTVIGSQGILFDITAIKRAEAERQKVEARYRMLVENTSDTITIIDPQGLIQFESDAVKQQLGYPPEKLVGRNVFDLLHPDDVPRARQILGQAMATPHMTMSVECRLRHHDGTWRTLQAVGKAIFTTADHPGIIISSRDITEHRKLEEQLRQSQKMEAIGLLAGGVAHDFNNIMAVIQMQLDLLKVSGDLVPDQLESADEIGKAAQRAASLTRQLLLFSRRETLHPSNLDLNESLTDITKMLQRLVGEDIQMTLKLAAHSLLVHADAGMIDQVLMNLAVNSRDAMPKGGQLVIETAAVEFDELATAQSVRARPGAFVRLSVSDTGTGIPPEILPRIFDPFFTTKGVGKGTGLGLATVFGIIQQHQGWIDVYSETGRGTTFRIYLPRLAESPGPKAGPATLMTTHGGKETILFVEDDPALRASVRNALAHLGYQVLEASDGASALQLWRQHRNSIDLLLTDLVMPGGMNGYELARQILWENPGLKVVYASGYCADVASDKTPLKEGFNFLSKPFDAPQLAQTLRNRLDGKGA